MLATNTIAQGDTREVGLDYLTAAGGTIIRAFKSRPWPGDASLEVAEVWLHRGFWSGVTMLDDVPVAAITSALEPKGRVSGLAHRLGASAGRCFQGSLVLGSGFLLAPQEAQEFIDRDRRNANVLFPYLNGEDLNTSPDQSPSRWVINFGEMSEREAREFGELWLHVERAVKPERMTKDAAKYPSMVSEWWRFWRIRAELYRAIGELSRVLAIALTSKTVVPLFVPAGSVYSHALGVFAYDDDAHLGLLSSGFHYLWAVTRASTMRTDIRYTPTDCFETFPQPELTEAVGKAGSALDAHRRALMLDRWEGLTKTYNRVHDPDERAEDIGELRRLHVELDHAVAVAYGWDDLPTDHDFHETRQGVRYTLGPATRTELLDRLLELNHQRAAAEAAAGVTRQRRGGARRRRQPGGGQTSLEAL